jgi:hypothetical protein
MFDVCSTHGILRERGAEITVPNVQRPIKLRLGMSYAWGIAGSRGKIADVDVRSTLECGGSTPL